MANEGQRPGGPSGIGRMLESVFHVPETPTLTREEVSVLIREAAEARGLAWRVLLLSDQSVTRGALFDASAKRVAFPEGAAYNRCHVALLDPSPEARWAHPAWWAFPEPQPSPLRQGTALWPAPK